MDKTNILFMGTAEFAIPALQKLIDSDEYDVVAVVTQPDKPVGRKRELTESPVRKFLLAENYKGRVYQPEKLRKDYEDMLAQSNPDLIVVAAYGQIIPAAIINFPKFKCLNIHGSLLPMYRGAIPIEKALLNGDKTTGVSILQMTPGLDDGPVLAEIELDITPEDDALSLRAVLAEQGAKLLLSVLPKWIEGEIDPISQKELAGKIGRIESYCYAKEMSREDAEIRLSDTVETAWGKVRAFAASRGAWLNIDYKGQQTPLKVWKALPRGVKPDNSLSLKLRNGYLELLELQLAGKTRGNAKEHSYLTRSSASTALT